MKRAIIALALGTMLVAASKKKADVLLGAAIHQEEAEGDLEAAIATYKKILAQYASDRSVAGKAQLRLGACYERLGITEASKAYELVLRNYSDVPELATQARARLAILQKSRPSGISVRQVWADPHGDLMGAVAADGSFLTATDPKTGDLALRDLATGEMRRVTTNKSLADGDAEYSVPSPDGKRIAYGWCHKGCDLRVINTDGTGMKVLYSNPAVRYVELYDWSPDGNQVLTVLQKENHRKNEMALIAVADGSVRLLKTMGFPHFDHMRFSPDGKYIVYSTPQKDNSREMDVSVMSTDGAYDAPVVTHGADDRALGWSPDGRQVLYSSNRTGATSVWSIGVSNGRAQGDPKLIKKDIGGISSMGVTKQGALYYSLRVESRDVYTAELSPETGKVLVPPSALAKRFAGGNSQPQWSPDGTSISYQAYRPGIDDHPSVAIHDMKNGHERVLVPELSNFGLSGWLPDGSGLVLRIDRGAKGVEFAKVDARTGELMSGPIPLLVSPDGKWTFRRQGSSVFARKVETNDEKEVYTGGNDSWLYGMRPSPDSTRLAVAVDNKLIVVPVSGDRPTEILTLSGVEKFATVAGGSVEWLGNSHLVYAKANDRRPVYWRVSAAGGPTLKMDVGLPDVSELRVQPGGRQIAFTSGARKNEVWVIENFLGRSAQ